MTGKKFITILFILEFLKKQQTTDKGFINFDDESIGGTHWKCFYVKHNRSLFVDSFGGPLEKTFSKKLPKPVIFRMYKNQRITSRLCGVYCLYFFYMKETCDYHNAVLIFYFG